jgi:hypothetical protein
MTIAIYAKPVNFFDIIICLTIVIIFSWDRFFLLGKDTTTDMTQVEVNRSFSTAQEMKPLIDD